MKSNIEYFLTRKQELEKNIETQEIINRRYSNLRLISFVLFLLFVVLFFAKNMSFLFFIPAVIFISFFVVLCIKHNNLKKELIHLKNLKLITEQYIARIEGNFSLLGEDGTEYLDMNHNYAYDLDVFGSVSLFRLYNISHTAFGKNAFANKLMGADLPTDVNLTQEAVKELIDNVELLQEYEAVSMEGQITKVPTSLINLYKSSDRLPNGSKMLYKILPVIWLIPVFAMVFVPQYVSAAVLFVILINLLVWFFVASKYGVVFKTLDGVIKQSEFYYQLFEILEAKTFNSELLKTLIKGGASLNAKASDGLKVLSKACNLANFRAQPLFALLLNCVFPYDLLCEDKLYSWSEKYGSELEKSISSIAQIEALMCASVPGLVSRDSVFPEVVDGAYFEGQNITHPLLNPKKAVSNSIKLEKELALITGSNMSGKTTLIRTVGICSLMAYMGAPVPAVYCKVGRMRIMSSMRIVDSIEEQMSTFRAELVRIGKIVEAVKTDDSPLLFLIDEIFRGTNSQDRTDGALAVLKNLDKSYITGLMTTHDYALCDKVQETVGSVVYYHFSEVYNDNEIIFDYKLHDGVSHKSNAKFLMKMVGIE